MKLNTLIGNVPGVVRRIGDMEVEIGQLCVDSRKAAPGAGALTHRTVTYRPLSL